jgi:radical SAM-linked protein
VARQPEGPPPPPVVQRLRVRYAKRGRLRFTSHRDFARAFERALRRAGAPMAFSQGFNPHPKISWVGAAPTGAASEAEYVEIQLVERLDPGKLAADLDAAMPPGLDVLEVVEAGTGSLADRIDASEWRIEVPGVTPGDLADAVAAFLAVEVAEVERLTKNGMRTINVRPAVVRAVTGEVSAAGEPCGILEVVVRQTTPAVRPDDVLSALRVVAALEPPVPAKATRMAQGRLDDGGALSDPLAGERVAASWQEPGLPEPSQSGVD